MLPRLLVLASLALIAAPRAAGAEPKTSVVIEPLYLVLPMVDATVEREVTPHVGIAAIAGYGKILLSSSLYDLGGQGNVYLQDFKGWHLGSEIRVLWGESSSPLFGFGGGNDQKMAFANERVVGVYGGYKWIASYGLTAVVQLGVGRMDMKSSSEAPWSKVIPVANLNAGWSW